MKKTAKIISIVLAVVMMACMVPFTAFADDAADERITGWKENYSMLLDTLLDNSNYTSWEYVDVNSKALSSTMNVYTAFALYDSAWRNYATHNVSVENAKQILLGLIGRAEYDFDDGYVDEIVSVLETAQNVNDFIQKVNQFTNIELFASSGWSTAFEVIGDVTKIANAYQNYRDQFIEAYARVLSVQMANAYYIDMLQYIIDNSNNQDLRTAAQELIANINSSVEDVIEDILAGAAGDGVDVGVDYLLRLALNSNAYTAVALKIYQGAKSVADFLWNTGELYNYMDTLVIAYDFQSLVSDWTAASLDGEDTDKAVIAVDLLLTARTISEEALRNFKVAQSNCAVGKIKSALYGNIYEDIEINIAAINAMREILFGEPDSFRKIVRVLYIYCPVDVQIRDADGRLLYTLSDGSSVTEENDYGKFVSVYSEYDEDYLKVVFLYDTFTVRLVGTGDGSVTMIMDVLQEDGAVEDWSFTDRSIFADGTIEFNTAFEDVPYYEASDRVGKIAFNDEFIPSVHPQPSAAEVAGAVVTVTKHEVKSFADIIRELFQKLFAALFSFSFLTK